MFLKKEMNSGSVRLAEWSKAPDLSSVSRERSVGSNPTSDNNFFWYLRPYSPCTFFSLLFDVMFVGIIQLLCSEGDVEI